MKTVKLQTESRFQMVDVTAQVRKIVRESGVMSGLCFVFCPHTTAAVTLNENTDENVRKDFMQALADAIPRDGRYAHAEGNSTHQVGESPGSATRAPEPGSNSDAHVKASLVGSSVQVLVENGKLVLGTWQAIYFCEFDGPRSRQLVVSVRG